MEYPDLNITTALKALLHKTLLGKASCTGAVHGGARGDGYLELLGSPANGEVAALGKGGADDSGLVGE